MGSTRYSVLKPQYESRFAQLQIRPNWTTKAVARAKEIASKKSSYDQISSKTGIPWFVVGVIHSLEADLSFSGHLHNGDPLTARTVNEPIGEPKTGFPPFTFEASAEDALKTKQNDSWKAVSATDWSIGAVLWRLETYNGWGYQQKDRANPYIWSGSQFYGDPPNTGKYTSDRVYNAQAISSQIGAAVLIKQMILLGFLDAKSLATTGNFTNVENGGLGCIDGGAGGGQTFSMQNPQTIFEAMQIAFGLDRKSKSLARNIETRLDGHADPAILRLETQKTFQLTEVGKDFEGEYMVEEVIFICGQSLEVKLIGNSPDPNAPPPTSFSQGGTIPQGTTVPAGSINQRIYQAAIQSKGSDTSSGPGGGNVACAWAINKIVLKAAGIKPIGKNQDYVSSVEQDLIAGRGQKVDTASAQNGDIVIMGANTRAHIGVVIGPDQIISNSSSKAKFSWIAGIAEYTRRYGECKVYRVLN